MSINSEAKNEERSLLWLLGPVLFLSTAMALYNLYVKGEYGSFVFVFALLPGIFGQIPALTKRKHLRLALSFLSVVVALALLGNEIYLAATG